MNLTGMKRSHMSVWFGVPIILVMFAAAICFNACGFGADANVTDTDAVNVETINITLTDEVQSGSVWIIQDTKDNRHKSVWGKAMITPEETGREYTADIQKSADDRYLFRMIDNDKIYYSTDIPALKDGWQLRLFRSYDVKTDYDICLEITDEKGNVIEACPVFNAAL